MIRVDRASWFLAIVLTSLTWAENQTLLDSDVKVVHFETLTYPLAARLAHVDGAVVIRAQLDAQGNVVTTMAISGAKTLIPDCLTNAKKWQFHPNSQNTAVIVYLFKIDGLCNLPCPSDFKFTPPNIVRITMGNPVVDHSAQ